MSDLSITEPRFKLFNGGPLGDRLTTTRLA